MLSFGKFALVSKQKQRKCGCGCYCMPCPIVDLCGVAIVSNIKHKKKDAHVNVNENITSMTVNPERVSYVLDPEANLTLTQKRLGDALRDIQINGGFAIGVE
jgi:hypothetical protein